MAHRFLKLSLVCMAIIASTDLKAQQAPVLWYDSPAEYWEEALPLGNGRLGAMVYGNPVNEAGDGWGYYDLGLQNENLLLKATELGLDTLVMGIRDGEAIREMLNIPETENVVAVIAVGYKAKEANMPKRKEVEEIAKFF